MDEKVVTCCECKKTARDEESKKALINRLSRIEGQIRGIKGMLEKDAYCVDLLIQSSAVSAAISSFNKELLEGHIKGCVVRDIKGGDYEVVDELMTILSRLMK